MKMSPSWPRFACLALVGSLLPLMAAAAPDTLPLDPAVRTGKLPNGLTYYIRKNVKPEKRVELRLAVNAGSVQEITVSTTGLPRADLQNSQFGVSTAGAGSGS